MNEKLLSFIEESFLSPLFKMDGITDISYNGVFIFYVLTKKGRQKADIKVSSSDAMDFIRQIANFSEKQFSYTNPILDVSVGKYRINAVHSSIVRVKDDKSCSFAIRIASETSRIKDDKNFMEKDAEEYLLNALNNEESIVIAGPTGSGKTELQKYLLSKLKDFSRVIIIDNILELDNLRTNENLDITSWQISQNNQNSSMNELIRNALRSNPDWLVVAEARGKEMNEVLNSAMTGHQIITTLHAKSLLKIPKRIARMVEMANINEKHEDVLSDIYEHLKIYVFVNRKFTKKSGVVRFVETIGEIDDNGKFKLVYERKKE